MSNQEPFAGLVWPWDRKLFKYPILPEFGKYKKIIRSDGLWMMNYKGEGVFLERFGDDDLEGV